MQDPEWASKEAWELSGWFGYAVSEMNFVECQLQAFATICACRMHGHYAQEQWEQCLAEFRRRTFGSLVWYVTQNAVPVLDKDLCAHLADAVVQRNALIHGFLMDERINQGGDEGIIAARKEIMDRASRFDALSNRLAYAVQAALEQFHEARKSARS